MSAYRYGLYAALKCSMPPDDQDVACAEALAAWLREQPIAPRTRTALLRNLELVTGERVGEGKEAQLRGLDPEAFLAQLHASDGGLIAGVSGLGARGSAALREALPLPAPEAPRRRRSARAQGQPVEKAPAPEPAAPQPAAPTTQISRGWSRRTICSLSGAGSIRRGAGRRSGSSLSCSLRDGIVALRSERSHTIEQEKHEHPHRCWWGCELWRSREGSNPDASTSPSFSRRVAVHSAGGSIAVWWARPESNWLPVGYEPIARPLSFWPEGVDEGDGDTPVLSAAGSPPACAAAAPAAPASRPSPSAAAGRPPPECRRGRSRSGAWSAAAARHPAARRSR